MFIYEPGKACHAYLLASRKGHNKPDTENFKGEQQHKDHRQYPFLHGAKLHGYPYSQSAGNAYLYAMLRRLFISNYAIIDQADIGFAEGMNIITGETGAGKSILLGALGLILGHRADNKVLFNRSKKCVVEGTFLLENDFLIDYFSENELDHATETILRRELSDNGKSRAFINDTPVTLQQLQTVAGALLTIHSQHETLQLGDSAFQRTLVDALANTTSLQETHRNAFLDWKTKAGALETLEQAMSKAAGEQDYLHFQWEELEKAGLDDIDQPDMESMVTQLSHAEEIQRSTSATAAILDTESANTADTIREALSRLRQAEKYVPELDAYIRRLESVLIEIRDIAADLEAMAQRTQSDPARLETLQQQLSVVYRLQKKHQVEDVAALIGLRETWKKQLDAFENREAMLEDKRRETSAALAKAHQTAKKLSDARKKILKSLENQVMELLAEVGMKDAQLQVEHLFDTEKYLSVHGADHIQFLFSANKGSALQDIKKVASGGELSRLMLCMKSLLAKNIALPTLIFDEIDTGVSGETAQKVGNILLKLSKQHQLIAITHLPQIAAKGAHHLFVYKSSGDDATHTHIKLLEGAARIEEIAKMLSGERPGTAALQNARDLMNA